MKQETIDIVNDVADYHNIGGDPIEITNPREIVEDVLKSHFKGIWHDYDEETADTYPKETIAPSGQEWCLKMRWEKNEGEYTYFISLDFWRMAGFRWNSNADDDCLKIMGYADPHDLMGMEI